MSLTVEQIMDCIENPTKIKIILTLQEKGSATPKELLKANNDIPQASLYRALKGMESVGILEVVSETKVRAVIEKTYAISSEFENMDEDLIKSNDGEAYYKMFSTFVIGLLKNFETYAKGKEISIAADGSSFNALPLYATAEELVEYGKQIEKVLAPATVRRSTKQKLHTFATIVTPPIESEKE